MPGRTRGRMFDIQPEHGVEDTGTGTYPGYPGYGDDSDVDPYDDYAEHYAGEDAARGARPGQPPNGAGGPTGRNGAPGDTRGRGPGGPRGAAPDGAGGRGQNRNGAARNGTARNGTARNGTARNGASANGAGPNGAARNGAAGGGPHSAGRNGAGPRPPAPDAASATAVVPPVRRDASGRFRSATPEERDERVAADGRWDRSEPPLLSHRSERDEPAYARDRTPQGFDGGDPDDPEWGRSGAPDAAHDGYADDPYADDEYDDEQYDDEQYDDDEYGVGDAPLSVPPPGSGGRPLGPADVEELDPSMTDALSRVDLGAIQVPVPFGAELKLEPAGAERPQAVHLLLPEGRIAVSALAAPRSSGLWADLSAEIEQSLRNGGARIRTARGDWGRELHARTENAASVFVGCDGPRWMVYGVATAALETVEALDVELRRVLRGIIVVRGKSPYPPRTVLPLELPEHMRSKQPEVAPQKPSITVSVPQPAGESGATKAPTTGATPRPDTGATPRPGTTATPRPDTGATPRPGTGATPRPDAVPAREDVRPAAPRRAAAAGPVSAPLRRPGGVAPEPETRALPAVTRRPAAASAVPPEDPAERTALARPVPPPEAPAERTAIAAGPLDLDEPDAPAPGANRRYGRPDRRSRAAEPARGGPVPDDREQLAPRRRTGPATGAGRVPAAEARPQPVHAPLPAHAPEPARAPERSFRAPERAPERSPEPAPELPVRRDPAVTSLSVADLLADAESARNEPVRGTTRSSDLPGRTDPPARVGEDAPTFGAGASGTAPAADRDPARRSRRRRPQDRDEAGRVDAAELLARSDAPAGHDDGLGDDRPESRPRPALAIEDIPLSDVPLMEATLDRAPEPPPALPRRERRERPVTTDQPERATDRSERATERSGRVTDRPERVSGRRRDENRNGAADEGWMSAEIAAARRSGRHGEGTGGGMSVADLLASAALDAGTGRRRSGTADAYTGAPSGRRGRTDEPAEPGHTHRHGTAAGAAEPTGAAPDRGTSAHSASGRQPDARETGHHGTGGHGAGGYEPSGYEPSGRAPGGYEPNGYRPGGYERGGYEPAGYAAGGQGTGARVNGTHVPDRDTGGHVDPGPAGDDLFRAPSTSADRYRDGGPTSADEARSALQDLLRSASAGQPDAGRAGTQGDGPARHGNGVTGLADYRASRAMASARGATGEPGEDPDEPVGEAGRAAGVSGATGQWSSGRRSNGTDPRDLGKHRRD